MQVKCLKKTVTATHTLKKGETYDLQSPAALKLVAAGLCEHIAEPEKATATPKKKSKAAK